MKSPPTSEILRGSWAAAGDPSAKAASTVTIPFSRELLRARRPRSQKLAAKRKISKQLMNHLARRGQAERDELFAGDADGVVDRRGEVGGRDGAVVRMLAAGVARADDAAAVDAAAGEQGAVAALPVIAAGVLVDA